MMTSVRAAEGRQRLDGPGGKASLPPFCRTLQRPGAGEEESNYSCLILRAENRRQKLDIRTHCAALRPAPESSDSGFSKNAICSVSTLASRAEWAGKLVMSASIMGWRKSSVEPTWQECSRVRM